jgi:uncharacterized protein YgiM (DUF1202 family)
MLIVSPHPRYTKTKLTHLLGPATEKGWDTIPWRNKGLQVYAYKWNDMWLKHVQEERFNLAIYVIDGWCPDGYYFDSQASSVYIKCTDKDGNDLLKVNQKQLTRLGTYLVHELMEYKYVNSSNGINVHQKPTTSSSVIHRFAHNNPVIILDHTNKKHTITRDNGKSIPSNWIEVYIDDNKSGYILETFLTDYKDLNPYRVYEHMGVSLQINDTWVALDTVNIKSTREEYNRTNGLSEYITIEIIDSNTFNSASKQNPYELQPMTQGIDVPSSHYEDNRVFSKKYPLLDSDDSIHVQSHPAEYAYSYYEIGYLPILEYYVFGGYSFGEFYEYRDAHSGKKLELDGYPSVSPKGSYLITTMQEQDPEIQYCPPTSILKITTLNNPKQKTSLLIHFSSWLPIESVDASVWESEDTVLLKVLPMSLQQRYAHDGTRGNQPIQCSYLRLKINQ